MKNTVTIILRIHKRKKEIDLEVPMSISANDLLIALNQAYDLNIKVEDVKNCYLKIENPIGFIKGNKTLSELGIRNGTIINITE